MFVDATQFFVSIMYEYIMGDYSYTELS